MAIRRLGFVMNRIISGFEFNQKTVRGTSCQPVVLKSGTGCHAKPHAGSRTNAHFYRIAKSRAGCLLAESAMQFYGEAVASVRP